MDHNIIAIYGNDIVMIVKDISKQWYSQKDKFYNRGHSLPVYMYVNRYTRDLCCKTVTTM